MKRTILILTALILLLGLTATAQTEVIVDNVGALDVNMQPTDAAQPNGYYYGILSERTRLTHAGDGFAKIKLYGQNYQYIHTNRGAADIRRIVETDADAIRFRVKTGGQSLAFNTRWDCNVENVGGVGMTTKLWYIKSLDGSVFEGGYDSLVRLPANFNGWVVFPMGNKYGTVENFACGTEGVVAGREHLPNLYHYVLFFHIDPWRGNDAEHNGTEIYIGNAQLVRYTEEELPPVTTVPNPTTLPTAPAVMQPVTTVDPGYYATPAPTPEGDGGLLIWICLGGAATIILITVTTLIIRRKKHKEAEK